MTNMMLKECRKISFPSFPTPTLVYKHHRKHQETQLKRARKWLLLSFLRALNNGGTTCGFTFGQNSSSVKSPRQSTQYPSFVKLKSASTYRPNSTPFAASKVNPTTPGTPSLVGLPLRGLPP